MLAVILAAGKGVRLEPITLTRPKPLIEIANKSILEWNLEQLSGIVKEVVIVTGHLENKIRERIGTSYTGMHIEYVEQKEQLGTGHALQCAKHLLDGKFIAMNGDDLYHKEDIAACAKHKYAVLGKEVNNARQFGIINEKGGHVVSIVEKPDVDRGLANTGLYVLDASIFGIELKKSPRGEYEIVDYVTELAKKEKVSVEAVKKYWQPITYPWDILNANKFILDEYGSQISDKAEIRPGSYIEDPVAIGDGAVTGPNCFIRKYSSIGNNCKVGNAVEIKNSVIMGGHSYVSHLSYVGDSVIGSDCNIGAGTIFANLRLDEGNVKMKINGVAVDSGLRKLGGIVGDNVKFGVGVLVMPGKKIWPNLLIPPKMTITDDVVEQPNLKEWVGKDDE